MAKNDIKYSVKVNVDGKSVIDVTRKSIEETGKAATQASGQTSKLGDSLRGAGKYGEQFAKIAERCRKSSAR